jgi:hypothetical protein
MRNYCCAAIIALAMTTAGGAAQVTRDNGPHTVLRSSSPGPGGAALATLLPHRKIAGFTRGATKPRTQTTPSGSAIIAPDGVDDGQSTPKHVYWDNVGPSDGIFG